MMKKIRFRTGFLLMVGMSLIWTACHTKKKVASSGTTGPSLSAMQKADKVISKARSFTGTPYKMGGETKAGIDCSGLIMVSFKEVNIMLPRTCLEQSERGKEIPVSQAGKGDLIFFHFDKTNNNPINHVGIVTGTHQGTLQFIHASTKKGVMENHTGEPYYKNGVVKVKRIL